MNYKSIPVRQVEISPWQTLVHEEFDAKTETAVPITEGYLPGAARDKMELKDENDVERGHRRREASMRESTQRRRER